MQSPLFFLSFSSSRVAGFFLVLPSPCTAGMEWNVQIFEAETREIDAALSLSRVWNDKKRNQFLSQFLSRFLYRMKAEVLSEMSGNKVLISSKWLTTPSANEISCKEIHLSNFTIKVILEILLCCYPISSCPNQYYIPRV